ncbi:hypothetical protein ACP275_04G173200 [Erythranthe tilingii]
MATPADAPSSSAEENPQTPAPWVQPPTVDDREDAKIEGVTESSPTSVFVNSEPIREEQVQNAVKFLSHPKVMGSPVMYRRSFLERKGLTKEEIDEAFRRVPDPTPNVATTEPVVSNRDGQAKSSSNVRPETATQVLQPNPVVPVGRSKMGIVSRFHWSHALLALGFLAASGAGTVVIFKNAIVPRFKSWIRKVASEENEGLPRKNNGKPSIAEEAAAAAKAAADAAADVARASRQMLMTKSEEKRCLEELIAMLTTQVHEMKSMRNSIKRLEDGQNISGRIAAAQQDDRRVFQNSPLANPPLVPKSKSWEVGQPQVNSTNILQTRGKQSNADEASSWWQRKNVRITDGNHNNERPVQRSWVPPRPPAVAMPEAAAAIRHRNKPSNDEKEGKMIGDQLRKSTPSPDVTDELQRITKISESGGPEEVNGET